MYNVSLLQVIKISKDPGPRGPRGFNGTNGLPGRPGYSNWTLCSYNHQASAGVSPSVYANQEVQITEPNVSHTLSTINHLGLREKWPL